MVLHINIYKLLAGKGQRIVQYLIRENYCKLFSLAARWSMQKPPNSWVLPWLLPFWRFHWTACSCANVRLMSEEKMEHAHEFKGNWQEKKIMEMLKRGSCFRWANCLVMSVCGGLVLGTVGRTEGIVQGWSLEAHFRSQQPVKVSHCSVADTNQICRVFSYLLWKWHLQLIRYILIRCWKTIE